MKSLITISLSLLLILLSCSESSNQNGWLIPQDEVFDGGPGQDGIPSIDNPNFTTASEVDFLDDNDLILGIKIGDEIKGYPHPILDWHEIVNDRVGGSSISLTYCPLTGTGIGWNRSINGVETTFGVSGLLYNTNLMPYDRASGSIWSQQRLDCVNGENIGQEAQLYPFIETTWRTWLRAYPESKVLNTDTGFDRNYTFYPYGDYRTNNGNIIFPISNRDTRREAKERVLGVRVDGAFIAYTFGDSRSPELIDDNFNGQDLLIIRSTEMNYISAFLAPADSRSFSISSAELPAIITDSEGNQYDLLGKPMGHTGSALQLADQFIGYWFSWGTFYPDIEIF